MQRLKWLVILASMLIFPQVAVAGDSGDVLVLMTEKVGPGLGAEQGVRFWWSDAQSPQWTQSDQVVFDALKNAGVSPMQPSRVNISRIYRRPELSTANAAQLAGLLGGQRVLVGRIEYRLIEPVAPLRYVGVEVFGEMELVAAGSTDEMSLQRFVVERRVYGAEAEVLLKDARQITGAALGEVMGRSLKRSSGQVGLSANGSVVLLRNVSSAANLEALRSRLLELEEIDRVVERWASEGVIALELNPGRNLSPDIAEYALRVLENHSFDDFSLQRSPRSTVEGAVEFWIEPREGRF